jgi:tetratricopeptide (TPR) repeat protein
VFRIKPKINLSIFIKSKLLFLFMILFLGKNTNAENVDTLFKRAQYFEKTNVDSAKVYYSKILGAEYLSEKMPDVYAKSLRKFAVLNAEINDDNLNVVYCKQAISIFKKIKNYKEVGITYNSIANIYQVKGFFDLAISNYQKLHPFLILFNFIKV